MSPVNHLQQKTTSSGEWSGQAVLRHMHHQHSSAVDNQLRSDGEGVPAQAHFLTPAAGVK